MEIDKSGQDGVPRTPRANLWPPCASCLIWSWPSLPSLALLVVTLWCLYYGTSSTADLLLPAPTDTHAQSCRPGDYRNNSSALFLSTITACSVVLCVCTATRPVCAESLAAEAAVGPTAETSCAEVQMQPQGPRLGQRVHLARASSSLSRSSLQERRRDGSRRSTSCL